MTPLPPVDPQYLIDTLVELLNIPSPTGFTERATERVATWLHEIPDLELARARKGTLTAFWPGDQAETARALTAHLDTLGAMVKEIKPNGRLKLSRIGSYAWNTVEGEGCTVFSSQGDPRRGSLLLAKASAHVYGEAVSSTEREDDTMEVRLDARTTGPEETRALGIEVGDFVAFDPRVEVIDGFIRSRHLDDKACVACLLAAVLALHQAGLRPAQPTTLHFSDHEEIGHGGAVGFPEEAVELLVVDMAAVGEGQTSDEFHATLCVKDSKGPYHHGFSQRLRRLAEAYQIPYKVDIFPYYSSDGQVAWRAGKDLAVALIGPGVDASHNYERTHMEALLATTRWIMAYLLSGPQ